MTSFMCTICICSSVHRLADSPPSMSMCDVSSWPTTHSYLLKIGAISATLVCYYFILLNTNMEHKQENYKYDWCFPSSMSQEHLGHLMAWSRYKWRGDGMFWTSGTIRHSSDLKKTFCRATFCDSRQPDQLVWLWNGLQKMAERDLENQRGHGKIHWKKILKRWVERRERDCQRLCQTETIRHSMFCLKQEELSLSK